MLKAEVFITLKKTVADPQGLTIKHVLESLGYKEVEDVRIGKLVTLKLNADTIEIAQQKLDEMCKKLLVNPVIEEYKFEINETTD